MNRYGRMAMEYQREYLPTAFGEISDPESFFTTAGKEIEAEVNALRDEILRRGAAGGAVGAPANAASNGTGGPMSPGSSQALAMAEEMVISDHYLFTMEPEQEEPVTEDDPELEAYYQDLEEVFELVARMHQ